MQGQIIIGNSGIYNISNFFPNCRTSSLVIRILRLSRKYRFFYPFVFPWIRIPHQNNPNITEPKQTSRDPSCRIAINAITPFKKHVTPAIKYTAVTFHTAGAGESCNSRPLVYNPQNISQTINSDAFEMKRKNKTAAVAAELGHCSF